MTPDKCGTKSQISPKNKEMVTIAYRSQKATLLILLMGKSTNKYEPIKKKIFTNKKEAIPNPSYKNSSANHAPILPNQFSTTTFRLANSLI